MRKIIILVSIAVISLCGCGNDTIENTIDSIEYESVTDTTGSNTTTSDVETSTDEDITTEKVTDETTTSVKETTTNKEETTTKKEETTTGEEVTTTTVTIPGVDSFDVNAERVELPSDKLLPGDDFSNAVFIGDSRTEGLTVYKVLTTSTILATRGLMASEAYSKKFVDMGDGTKGTTIDYIKAKQFDRVYIMLGLNEMGGSVKNFTDTYGILIDKVKEALPEAKIYAISIIPMIEERTDDTYNNPKINKFNEALKQLVEEKGIVYVNAQAAVVNEQGTLRNDLSKDGIHLRTPGLTMFMNYLILATSEAYADR